MRAAVLLGLLLLSGLAGAVEVGQPLPQWSLLDQFDKPSTSAEWPRVLLAARSMDGAKLVETAMADRAAGWLEQRHVLFVADVSRMPKLIASLFALPAMRDYSYRVVLDRESTLVPQLRAPEKAVLWLDIDAQGRVLARREYTGAADLRQALEQVKP